MAEIEGHSYRKTFRRAHGDGPYECFFCRDMIFKRKGRGPDCLVVHHKNGDHDDNVLENLVATHYLCHARWHSENMSLVQRAQLAEAARGNTYRRGQKATAETLQKLRESHLGKKQSPESVAKRAASNRGKKRTPEQIARLREGRWGKTKSA